MEHASYFMKELKENIDTNIDLTNNETEILASSLIHQFTE